LLAFSWYLIPKPDKNVPNEHKMYQTVIKYSKWPYSLSIISDLTPSKIYPNWDFWFENEPSGNPCSKPI
jgi:hypothetical protein